VSITPLDASGVSARAVEAMGLNPEVGDAFTPEALSAALRRTASFLCPATPAQLIDAVRDTLAPLPHGCDLARDDLAELLEQLLSTGDLLQLRQSGERTARLLYLGPPSFVTRVPGEYLLLGIRPEGRAIIEGQWTLRAEAHLRTLRLAPERAEPLLAAAGLHELRRDRWLRYPRRTTPTETLTEYRTRLDAARSAGAVEGLELLDPAAPVRFYRGRWRSLKANDSGERGDFVGRRPQAYGANAWCFVRVEGGRPQRMIDLPAFDPAALAHDEAWRLQAAIDAERSTPQLYRVRPLPGDDASVVLDLFGPVPSWAERHLGLLGTPLGRGSGALFTYRFGAAAIGDAEALLTDMLWMRRLDEGGFA